jgi:peptide chain release factor subunit 1
LLTDPSTGPGSNLHAQLGDLMRQLRQRVDLATPSGQQLTRAITAVEQYTKNLGTPPRSLTFFSCVERDFFRAVRLPERVAPNAYWGETPYVWPLLAVLDEYERTMVVLLDKERARIFRVFLQEIDEIADLIETTPGKHRQHGGAYAYPPSPDRTRGGFADSGITRHEEMHVLRHAKQAAKTLMLLAARERVDRIIVGGTPEVLAEFRCPLPRGLRARVATEEVRVPLFAEPATVLAAAQDVMERVEREAEARLIAEVREAVGSARSVLGPAVVVDAVLGARVALLIIGEETRMRGRMCERCGHLALLPAPTACPVCAGVMHRTPDVAVHLIPRVLEQGGRVEEVRGAAAERLAPDGGIAAMLRYRVPAEVLAVSAST